jgi:hypothetical protein
MKMGSGLKGVGVAVGKAGGEVEDAGDITAFEGWD